MSAPRTRWSHRLVTANLLTVLGAHTAGASPQDAATLPTRQPLGQAPAQADAALDVTVTANGPASLHAPPLEGWSPEDVGLPLLYREAESLNADWVRRQFGPEAAPIASVSGLLSRIEAINVALVQNGYVNSGVRLSPGQDAPANVFALELVYGQIRQDGASSIEWPETGRGGLDEPFIRNRLPSLSHTPFNAFDLETEFRLLAEDPRLNRLSGRLEPTTTTGVAEFDLQAVPADRFALYLEIANSRAPSVGGERAALGGSVRNLLRPGDRVAVEVGVTDGLADQQLTYATPFLIPAIEADLMVQHTDAGVVESSLRPLDIESETLQAELGLTSTLVARPVLPASDRSDGRAGASLRIRGSLAFHETETSLLGMPFSFSPGAEDGETRFVAARLSADLVIRQADRANVWRASLSQGLSGTGRVQPGLLPPDEHFTVVGLEHNRVRRIGEHSLGIQARLSGQWSSGLLYPAERLAVGGVNTVRGYSENLVLGDRGVIGSIELFREIGSAADGTAPLRLSVFADGAVVENERAPEPRPDTLSSIGLAAHWRPLPQLGLGVAYGYGFEDDVLPVDGLQGEGIHVQVRLTPVPWQ